MFKNTKIDQTSLPMDNIEEKNQELSAELPQQPLIITEDIRSYLYDMAKWTKFLSIVGFVITALVAMMGFGAGAFVAVLAKMSPGNPLGAMGSGFLTVYFLVIALLYFYPSLLMFKHSNATNKAILYGDQESLADAMNNLKSFFKFWGILMIVLISFYVLTLILVIVAGMGAAVGAA
jgi:hypothetical protein